MYRDYPNSWDLENQISMGTEPRRAVTFSGAFERSAKTELERLKSPFLSAEMPTVPAQIIPILIPERIPLQVDEKEGRGAFAWLAGAFLLGMIAGIAVLFARAIR